jgi:hypothetical protein
MAQTSLHRVEWVTPDQWQARFRPAYTTPPWPEGVTAVSRARYTLTDHLAESLRLSRAACWELVVVEDPGFGAPWWGSRIQSRQVSAVAPGPDGSARQEVVLDYEELIEIDGRLYELIAAPDPVPAYSALAVRPLGESRERDWRRRYAHLFSTES